MKYVYVLSKQNLNLASYEVISQVKSGFELIDNLLLTEPKRGLQKQLGLTHEIHELLFKCNKAQLETIIREFDWDFYVKKDFAVRTHGTLSEKDLADKLYKVISNRKVNLKNPYTKFEFFLKDKIVIATRFLYKVDKSCLKRKAHLRPKLHPTSLDPRLARACINLTGLQKGKILDPFCGSGGILIEAGLMGFNTIGYDIDPKQIERAKINLAYYNVNTKLQVKDALFLNQKIDAIVTDLPYGKNSKAKNIEELLNTFLKISPQYTSNMVMILPDFISPKIKSPWQKIHQFEVYIHKNLTRKIIVLLC